MSYNSIKSAIKQQSNPSRAKISQSFFKTGKGEYGEGDIFLGLTVPQCRETAIKFKTLSLNDVESLLNSKIHEERLISLLILVHNYEKSPEKRKEIFDFYINHLKFVNNWDLVDLSASRIMGNYLLDKDKLILYNLAKSRNLWEKRVSIISTLAFIYNNKFEDTLKITAVLMQDKHDLIHKACGWMLREVGKKDKSALVLFLKKHYKLMPRTMLRYSIERFPETERKAYLKGTVK